MYPRRLLAASIPLSLVALTTLASAAPPARASLEILIDASVATTETSLGGLPMVLDALRTEAALAGRDDLEIAVRLYGTKNDPGAIDCTATTLAVDFGSLDAERIDAGLTNVPASRRVAPLSHAIAQAVADLTARASRQRFLFIVAGAEDGCGADACKAIQAARVRGVTSAGAIVLSASRTSVHNLQCLGSVSAVRDPVGVREAIASVLHDAGATTGIALIHHSGENRVETIRYSLTPLPPPAREGLKSSSDAADVRGVAPGRYLLTREDRATAAETVHITAGQVTVIEQGRGTLIARAENFYGAAIRDASLEIRPFTTDGTAPARAGRGRIPHSSLPVQPPTGEDIEATSSGTNDTRVEAVGAQATLDEALPSSFIRAPLGEPVALAPGRYEIVISHNGATIKLQVEIRSGRQATANARFGAIKLAGPGGAVRVLDRAGNLLAVARDGRYVDLPPGRYRLERGNSTADDAEVIAGEVTLIQPGG